MGERRVVSRVLEEHDVARGAAIPESDRAALEQEDPAADVVPRGGGFELGEELRTLGQARVEEASLVRRARQSPRELEKLAHRGGVPVLAELVPAGRVVQEASDLARHLVPGLAREPREVVLERGAELDAVVIEVRQDVTERPRRLHDLREVRRDGERRHHENVDRRRHLVEGRQRLEHPLVAAEEVTIATSMRENVPRRLDTRRT